MLAVCIYSSKPWKYSDGKDRTYIVVVGGGGDR